MLIQCRLNVDATPRHDVASTLRRRCINVMWPLGSFWRLPLEDSNQPTRSRSLVNIRSHEETLHYWVSKMFPVKILIKVCQIWSTHTGSSHCPPCFLPINMSCRNLTESYPRKFLWNISCTFWGDIFAIARYEAKESRPLAPMSFNRSTCVGDTLQKVT